MNGRLHPQHINNASWFVHPSTLPQLLTLSIETGTSGWYVPVLNQTGSGMSIFNRPVVVSEHCSPLGDQGDVVLADMSQYVVGLRSEISFARSEHAYFSSDHVGFRWITRVDGMPSWQSAYTPRYRSDTLSPFVVLVERA